MKIAHIRFRYLELSFLYYLLKGFRLHEHIILVKEINQKDVITYPYKNIVLANKIAKFVLFINKIGIKIFRLNRYLINDWFSNYFALKNLNINLIHAHFGPEGYYAIPISKKLNVPLVVTFYGYDMSKLPKYPIWQKRYSKLFKLSSAICVEGEFMKQQMVKIGCSENKVFVSKIGILINEIPFSHRTKLLPNKDIKILMCANFEEKKGFLDALDAIAILIKEGYNIKVGIIGSGRIKEQILNLIQINKLSEHVNLLGRVPFKKIYKISEDYHIFLHPSKIAQNGDTEGGAPTIILEMQALGLPIISTLHADIPNIIPEENYFLAKEGDIEGIVEQFKKCISSQDEWDSISDRGRKFVELEHSNKVVAEKLENFYLKFYQNSTDHN